MLASLVRRAQRSDADAFDELIDRYSPRLYGFFYRTSGSRDDADDLLQELFLRVVRTIDRYEHDRRFDAWLFRIAGNLARDRIRKIKRAPRLYALNSEPDAEQPGGAEPRAAAAAPDARAAKVEETDRLNDALARLSRPDREIVMLRHFSQMSFAQIAAVLDAPLGTVLARAHRALHKLRRLLGAAE